MIYEVNLTTQWADLTTQSLPGTGIVVGVVADSFSLQDTATLEHLTFNTTATDGIDFSDIAIGDVDFVTAVLDSIDFCGVPSAVGTFVTSTTDILNLQDTPTGITAFVTEVIDSIDFDDTTSIALLILFASAADSIDFGDDTSATLFAVTSVTDSISFNDTPLAKGGIVITLAIFTAEGLVTTFVASDKAPIINVNNEVIVFRARDITGI